MIAAAPRREAARAGSRAGAARRRVIAEPPDLSALLGANGAGEGAGRTFRGGVVARRAFPVAPPRRLGAMRDHVLGIRR